MRREKVIRILPDGTEFEAFKMWDGYLTVSTKTAKILSVTGKLPKAGFEIKTKYVYPKIGLFEERQAWLSRTIYEGKEEFYLS